MMLSYTSWNVRGLESPDRKYILRRFLNLEKNKDFVFLQELKAVGFTLETNLNFFWGNSTQVTTKHDKGRGGVAILISHNWTQHLSGVGASPCNRVVWATFVKGDTRFGVCSMYAPNDYKERIVLWKWLLDLPNIPWVVGGDFNMVENDEDKKGGLNLEWKSHEKLFWMR